MRCLLNAYFNCGYLDINNMPWGAGDNRRYYYQAVSPVPYNELSREDIIQIRPAALMNLAVGIGQKPLIVKSHHFYGQINNVHLFPKLLTKRAFYLLRDPREIAPSYAAHMNCSLDDAIIQMADEAWTIGENDQSYHVLSSWSQNVKSWIQHKDFPVHVIKYAKLKADPASILAGILDRIGFDEIDSRLIDKAVEATQLEKLKAQELVKGFEESPTGNQFFGGERASLSDAQRSRIERDHAEVMNLVAL